MCAIHRHRFNYLIWNVSYEDRNKSALQMDKTLPEDRRYRFGLPPLWNFEAYPAEMAKAISRIRP